MSKEFCGNINADAVTMEVYNLIVRNYDVIKGVFHGHYHSNMYTEIMAQDAQGNFVQDGNGGYVTIPQYGVHSVAEMGGQILNITIK